VSVSKRSLNGIGDGPGVQSVGLDEMKIGRWRGEEAFGESARGGSDGGGLKEFTAIGHDCSLGIGP